MTERARFKDYATKLAEAEHQFGYTWFSTSLEECQMKRFVSSPVIFAALAAVILLPIEDARAETSDDLRKKGLKMLVEQVNRLGSNALLENVTVVNRGEKNQHLRIAESRRLETITCSNNRIPAPKFHYIFKSLKCKSNWNVTFEIPHAIVPVTFGEKSTGTMPSKLKIHEKIKVSASCSLNDAGTAIVWVKYARFIFHKSDIGHRPEAYEKPVKFARIDATEDGRWILGEMVDAYQIPATKNTIVDAQALCKAKGADEIQTILKRIQDASSQ